MKLTNTDKCEYANNLKDKQIGAEADLISRSALIRHFKKGGEVGIKTGASPELVEIVLRGVIGQITAEPEVDAVKVVRCKECIYSKHEPCEGYDNDYICNRTPFARMEGGRLPSFYCGYGENDINVLNKKNTR